MAIGQFDFWAVTHILYSPNNFYETLLIYHCSVVTQCINIRYGMHKRNGKISSTHAHIHIVLCRAGMIHPTHDPIRFT